MLPATIGPFQIQREIGRGGMGVVYLATDTRLDRPVAIKALPADLAADPDRLARFQREAKVLASLNHPHVAAIHGLEHANGHEYLILEYIEGESLHERVCKGPIAVDDSLSFARQIAEALEAAHEKGIIHRDLKPGNVMVTPDGVVKVLDFGLARTADGSPSTTDANAIANSPTVVARHSPTIPGAIMGTAGYMSPEQARGKPVDKRSDIFSFGCVLFEMLAGTGPFPGETVTDSLGAILHRDPNWALLPPATPRRIRELLTSCLAKERKSRPHDIADARLELERAIAGREWIASADSSPARKNSRAVAIAAAGAAALLAGGVAWIAASKVAQPAAVAVAPAQTFHVSTTIPSKPPFQGLWGISPDARFLIYTAWPELEADSSKAQGVLVVRRLDRDETIVLEGTEGARTAALSPDGRWVAFSSAKDRAGTKFSLRKIALDNGRPTGRPETICELPQGSYFQLGWASDREVVFAPNLEQAIYAVAVSGGEPRVVVREEQPEGLGGWDQFTPLVAGQSMLAAHFSIVAEKVKVNTEVIDLASGKRTIVLSDAGAMGVLTDSVRGETLVVYGKPDLTNLLAVRFDLGTLRTLGEPVRVWSGNTITQVKISSSGTLALSTRASDFSNRRLAWLDDKGQPQPLAVPTRAFFEIAVSPDGGRVLANLEMSNPDDLTSELWVQDLTRRTSMRIPIQGFAQGLMWNPSGQRVVHGSFAKDEFAIVERPASGSGEPVKMFASPLADQKFLQPSAWSPDGKMLAIVQSDMKVNKSDVLMLEQGAGADGNATWKATPYLNSPDDEHALRFSPDGKWVLFCSVQSGRHELYMQRFTGAGAGVEDGKAGRVQVSTNGHDGSAWWSPDGKELRFVDGDRQVVSVEVKTEPTLSVSMPKPLYSIKELKTTSFTWGPDGRLMVILQGESELATRIDLVVNFAEEMREKMMPLK